MSSEWPKVEIQEVCSVGDGAHSKVERTEDGVLYLTSKNIGQGVLKLEKTDYISEASFEKLFPLNSRAIRRPQAGDLLIGIIGTFGNSYLYKESDHFGFASSIGILRPNKNLVNPKYLYYVISSPKFKSLHSSSDGGSVQGYTNIPTIKKLPIYLPPLNVQEKISTLLGCLDDRIALLRETNATLEAIAQALFKSWFVDFDPVHANAGTQAPSLPPEIQALFPATFTDSPQGTIPDGWNVKPIDEVAVKVGMGPFGSNIKVSTFVPTGVPVLNGKNISTALMDDNCENFITEEHSIKLKSSCVTSGDIVITHRGTLGQVALVPDGLKYDEFVVSQSQFYIRCDRTRMVPEWLLYFFRSPFGQQQLLLNTSQVGVPSIARPVSHMRTLKITVPSIDVLECFSSITGDIHKKIVHNRQQAQNLESLRDTLLPRLISGQLRLPEVEQAVAAITD